MYGGFAPLLHDYIELLQQASRELLRREFPLDLREADSLISDFLRRNGYPSAMPSYMEVRHYLSGEVVLLGGEVSPYPMLGLRLVFPSGTDVEYDLPLSEHQTSLRRAAAELAGLKAAERGAKVAVRIDSEGFVRSVDDEEPFLVREYTVYIPQEPTLPEARCVVEHIRKAGLNVVVAPIPRAMLDDADELFYVDYRGVTALGSYNSRALMHIIAERVSTIF